MGKKEWEKDVVLKKLDERSYEIETPSGTSEEIVLTSGKPQRYHLSHCKHPMRLRRMRTHHPQHPHQSSDAVPETQPGWQGPGQQSGNLVPRVFYAKSGHVTRPYQGISLPKSKYPGYEVATAVCEDNCTSELSRGLYNIGPGYGLWACYLSPSQRREAPFQA